MEQCNTLVAATEDVTTLNDLYPLIRQGMSNKDNPIYMPIPLVRLGLMLEKLLRKILFLQDCIEEDWMFKYIDKPIETDPSQTFTITGWKPRPSHHITNKILHMTKTAHENPDEWNQVQNNRLHKPKY